MTYTVLVYWPGNEVMLYQNVDAGWFDRMGWLRWAVQLEIIPRRSRQL